MPQLLDEKIVLNQEAQRSIMDNGFCVVPLAHDEPEQGDVLVAEIQGHRIGVTVVAVQQGEPGSESHIRFVILAL